MPASTTVPVEAELKDHKEALPAGSPADWKPEELHAKLKAQGLDGVCNALSAAWLAGLVEPGGESKATGVNAGNWTQLVWFKNLLDEIVENDKLRQLTSADLTWGFLDYWDKKKKQLGSAVPERLTNADSMRAELVGFEKFVEGDEPESKDDEDDADAAEEGVKRKGTAKGTYKRLTRERIGEAVEESLANFAVDEALTGLIVIKAKRADETFAGHQLAIRYRPGPPGQKQGTLELLDQNAGLRSKDVRSAEDIAAFVGEFLNTGYVENPIEGTVSAEFAITVKGGAAPVQAKADLPQPAAELKVPGDAAVTRLQTEDEVEAWFAKRRKEPGWTPIEAFTDEQYGNDVQEWLKGKHGVALQEPGKTYFAIKMSELLGL